MSWHIRMDLEIRPSVWWRDQHPQLHSTKNCHFRDLNWRYLPGQFFSGLWGYAREYPQKNYGLRRHYLHFRGLKFVGFTACWTGLQQRKQRVGSVSSWGCLLLDGLTDDDIHRSKPWPLSPGIIQRVKHQTLRALISWDLGQTGQASTTIISDFCAQELVGDLWSKTLLDLLVPGQIPAIWLAGNSLKEMDEMEFSSELTNWGKMSIAMFDY